MTREEFIKKLQLCYFGEKKAFNEIVKYFESLQEQISYLRRSVERKEEQIADWQSDYVLAQTKIDEAIDYIKNKTIYSDENGNYSLNTIFDLEDLLEILERAGK